MRARRAEKTPAGTIHRTIALLNEALEELGADMPLAEEERVGVMINQAMTAEARSFHTPEHVFDLVQAGRPHLTLAALFHDLVYYQVDHGFVPQIAKVVQSSIETINGELRIRTNADPNERALAITLAVFGMQPGWTLSPFGGMNEFLSALVMNRSLAGVVRASDLLCATACIEATIPFRMPDSAGRTPPVVLVERLQEATVRLGLGLSQEALKDVVRNAVTFSNSDVSNFAESEVTRFLDNTWKLLPETNPSLRVQGVYTIKSYRIALMKMEGFLRSLDPVNVFMRYEDVPSEQDYRRKISRARRNITTAQAYLGIKLLTAAILEALAEISGGDAPMSLFMGDIGERRKGSKLEDYLPEYDSKEDLALDVTLHDLLAQGRASASSFDLQNSPLSLFIYLHLGGEGFRDYLDAARRLFDGVGEPRAFLETLPRDLLVPIAEGCARMAFTRAPVLRAFAAEIRARGGKAPRRPTAASGPAAGKGKTAGSGPTAGNGQTNGGGNAPQPRPSGRKVADRREKRPPG